MPLMRRRVLSFALTPMAKRYRCGQKSAFALANMIGRTVVSCEPKGRDRYKHTIAVCFKGEINLNSWMVQQGWAVAYRKYGMDFVLQEDEAQLCPPRYLGRLLRDALGTGGREIVE
jgi:endonuclease YncB( thermonuclease family)